MELTKEKIERWKEACTIGAGENARFNHAEGFKELCDLALSVEPLQQRVKELEDELARIGAKQKRKKEMNDLQLICTAPKDGTWIFLLPRKCGESIKAHWFKEKCFDSERWVTKAGIWCDETDWPFWLPLPDPPKMTEQTK